MTATIPDEDNLPGSGDGTTGMIFDLDGTIMDTYALDEELYREAVLSEAPGVRFRESWLQYADSTDSGILHEILAEYGLPADMYYEPIRRRFGKLVRRRLDSSNPIGLIPGAAALLNRLAQIQTVQIGIATGGWHHTAKMKLEAAGLWELNIPMATSDDARSRTTIMKICAGRMRPSISRFIYVGDGEWDLESASELDWEFIGVGKRLKGKCDVWVPDLTDEKPFVKSLGDSTGRPASKEA
jgi:phosphoglycolate phosphatase-like HAD superfamily hydrolase